ncbi:MAG: MFS transporter [Deltaproteobacteria bacterium HGW-Deltaproteobacteria-12]|jgi:MFS family permease|nr:MAG: MFS transporter [Deltaproteobacteria bacterium HGW-Deltaproteobacteria-12]
MNKERLWTKNFLTVSLINFLTFLTHFLLLVVIASYAVDKFHASTSMAGLVVGIFIIGILFGRLGTGRVIEDIGSKRVLLVGSLAYIITSVLYFTAINLPLLIIIRFLHGFAYGIASTAAGTIVAQIIPKSRHGEGIGYYSMSAILAVALGPFVGILLIQHVDFNLIFTFTSLLAVISFAISFVVQAPAGKPAEQDRAEAVKNFQISNYLEFKAIPISVVILVIGFSYSVVIAFISLYTKQIHLEEAASFYFLVYAVIVFISRPVSGRLFDLKGANFVAYPCLFIFAVGMLLFSQASQGITLLSAGALIGLGYGNFISCAQAISIKDVLPHRLGLATATFFIFVDLGFGAGPYLLGFLIPFTGYRGLYLIMAILILATIPLYYFLYGRKASS